MMRLPPVAPRPPAVAQILRAARPVLIFHPAQKTWPILSFPVFPSSPENGSIGFPLGAVLDACYAVAFNRRGRLVEKDSLALVADESFALESLPDNLLVVGDYLFYTVGENGQQEEDYEICSRFINWVPPAVIPSRWQGGELDEEQSNIDLQVSKSEVSVTVKDLDSYKCIITGVGESLNSSHVVPRGERPWWCRHEDIISSYSPGRRAGIADLNSIYNRISLRVDLEELLDLGYFLLVPYGGKIVAVVVNVTAQTLAYSCHLREVNFPDRIPRPYLFIRFIWSVLRKNAAALEIYAKARRKLKQPTTASIQEKTPDEEDESMEWEASTRSGDDHEGTGSSNRSGSKERWSDSGSSGGQARSGAAGRLTESYLKILEAQDAALTARGTLTMDDERAGRYPGFSAIERLKMAYWQAHPEISAVGGLDTAESPPEIPGNE
ncbi:hypothetical protein MSAN_01150200 [Mycena sanguinolenta]|uniref:HNH nuclease domain-containing protein n=1 Tax=Mycena sanguinolenta TaxID=230812 RepID=A0A8H7D709_9AGAR|nr:hypothetical protein MSAN_01150200 [Mycena sanguinolenta]